MKQERLKTRREFIKTQPQNEKTAPIGYEIINHMEAIYRILENNKIENENIEEALLHFYNKICCELIYRKEFFNDTVC